LALEDVSAPRGLVGVGRERARVDGTDRGPAKDTDRHVPSDVFSHLGQDVDHDPDLVGPSRRTSRQNEPYQTAGHEIILAPRLTKTQFRVGGGPTRPMEGHRQASLPQQMSSKYGAEHGQQLELTTGPLQLARQLTGRKHSEMVHDGPESPVTGW